MTALDPLKSLLKRTLPEPVLGRLRHAATRVRGRASFTNTSYWSRHNVTAHHSFATREESLAYFEWRNDLYPGYLEKLPVAGHDGKVVLDFGCGPGHDLVGFAHFSRPARLIGMDISPVSLAEAKARLALHGAAVEWVQLEEDQLRLPLEDSSVDLVHSSGVLHHTVDPLALLRDFRRILRPGGSAQIMVYNYESLHLHLYVAYVLRIVQGRWAELPLREAFARTTDGEHCPIAEVYRPAEFAAMAEAAGLRCAYLGAAPSMLELQLLPRRFEATSDRRLPAEQRRFLAGLEFDRRGLPLFEGQHAGVDGCYRLTPSD
jgi:ubiquinone/menaquinone biosynthesis C-methylase UbiE